MEIVDAHMHFWTPQTHPWVTKAAREGGHPAGSFGKYASMQVYIYDAAKVGVPMMNVSLSQHPSRLTLWRSTARTLRATT